MAGSDEPLVTLDEVPLTHSDRQELMASGEILFVGEVKDASEIPAIMEKVRRLLMDRAKQCLAKGDSFRFGFVILEEDEITSSVETGGKAAAVMDEMQTEKTIDKQAPADGMTWDAPVEAGKDEDLVGFSLPEPFDPDIYFGTDCASSP